MRTTLPAAFLAALALVLPGTAANAAPPPGAGLTCGLAVADEPIFSGPGEHRGVEWGGPVAAVDLTLSPVTVTCSIQIGGTGVHSDPDDPFSTVSGSGKLVAVAGPGIVSFVAFTGDPVYLCTAITARDSSGTVKTWYYDTTTGRLVSSSSAAQCALAIQQQVPQPVCDVLPSLCSDIDVRVVIPQLFTMP